jgi:hypothetical protein
VEWGHVPLGEFRTAPTTGKLASGHRFEVIDNVDAAVATLVAWGVVRSMTTQCTTMIA